MDKKAIKDWAKDDRPREKLLTKGVSVLSDAELLGILIGSGTPQRSALDLGRDILNLAHNNLNELGKLPLNELCKIPGIGQARSIIVSAAMELGRRRQIGTVLDRQHIKNADDASELLFPLLQDLEHEMFCVLYLNHAQLLIKYEFISSGGLSSTTADIRMILKNALMCNSSKIIVAHNHPSGNKMPSESDKKLTIRLKDAAKTMDIDLIDHIIIAHNQFLSFAREGVI
jgi:DNA repair protein RadC